MSTFRYKGTFLPVQVYISTGISVHSTGTSVYIYRYKCIYLPVQVYVSTGTSVHIYWYKSMYLPVQVYISTGTSVCIYRYKCTYLPIQDRHLHTASRNTKFHSQTRKASVPTDQSVPLSAPNSRSPCAEALADSLASSGTPHVCPVPAAGGHAVARSHWTPTAVMSCTDICISCNLHVFCWWVLAVLFPGVRRPELESDHSPPCRAEVKNKWSYSSALPIRLHVMQRNNYTFHHCT